MQEQYRLKRNSRQPFQNFRESLRIPQPLLDLSQAHYSAWYTAGTMQELANKLEFAEEAETDDEIVNEADEVVGTVAEEFATPYMIAKDGVAYLGPELAAMGDYSGLNDEEYTGRTMSVVAKKSN